jgi:hypothetical protein
VIFETGEAPSRGQVRIDVPIIFSDVSYVGAAFPILIIHDEEPRYLTVSGAGVQETAEPLANMDAIVALDFKNEYPSIITKTLISTVAKGAAGWAINQAASQQDAIGGLIARLGTAVAQASVNIADTRSWTTLPKDFQVARINTPADRRLTLSAPGAAPAEVMVQPGTVNVVYVRCVRIGTPLLVSQFKLRNLYENSLASVRGGRPGRRVVRHRLHHFGEHGGTSAAFRPARDAAGQTRDDRSLPG